MLEQCLETWWFFRFFLENENILQNIILKNYKKKRRSVGSNHEWNNQ
jgi:hypothetical protein